MKRVVDYGVGEDSGRVKGDELWQGEKVIVRPEEGMISWCRNLSKRLARRRKSIELFMKMQKRNHLSTKPNAMTYLQIYVHILYQR